MIEVHHDNPVATMVIGAGSAVAGVMSWAADPSVAKALVVAAACGFVGGLMKAAGVWAWNLVRERRNARKQ
ncbi:MAG: hypothetical protein JST38_08415 [Bacteroidetes bacterium]|nr:hypothetical protein [Bacteroidota bacterium]